MRLLIDTQIFLWLLNGDAKLPVKLKSKLLKKSNSIFISIASLWEINIKVSRGKLEFDLSLDDLYKLFDEFGLELLDIKAEHTFFLRNLDFHHKDPFDRILFSQAIMEDLTLVSSDQVFDLYLSPQGRARMFN